MNSLRNHSFSLAILLLIVVGFWFFLTKENFLRNSIIKTESQLNELNGGQVKLIGKEEFDLLASDPSTFVVDVHIPEQAHIPGTDAFIAYNSIEENLDKLPGDKDTPILVYCRSGSMSKKAGQTIAQLGYKKVYDLAGGTDAYKADYQKVAISPLTYDLGTVIYGNVAETKFNLTNFTADNLNITRVSTSCGCTKARTEKENIGPYQETQIEVSFDPAVHKDDTDLGEITRSIYIDTDNKEFPRLEAEITANVIKKET